MVKTFEIIAALTSSLISILKRFS